MRLFIGVPLAPAVIADLSAISARLQSKGDGLRWSSPASWHITLQFLGNTTPKQYGCVVARLRELHLSPFSIQLEGLGFFERSGVFFAGVTVTPELLQLQKQVTAATEPCGFVPDARPFQPHITLARTSGKSQPSSLHKLKTRTSTQPAFTRFAAQEFLLYESFLSPTGSRYEIRHRFPLVRP